jgi:hypothetical protein
LAATVVEEISKLDAALRGLQDFRLHDDEPASSEGKKRDRWSPFESWPARSLKL